MKRILLISLFSFLSLWGYGQSCTLAVSISSSDSSICSGNAVVLTAVPSNGTPNYTYVWNTGDTTSTITVNKGGTYTVTVSDQTPGCSPVAGSITINSIPVPAAPTAYNVPVCPNSSATLTATAPGGTYQWYDALTGGNLLATGATFTTPPLTNYTVYYVQTTVGACTSTRTTAAVYLISGPTVYNTAICSGNSATLSASGADNYQWYDAPSGGNLLSSTSTYTTPVLNDTTTYYVVGITQNCVSVRVPITAYVNQAPPPPTASGAAICSGSAANLHADAPGGGIVDWFDVPSGGVSLISSPDFTTPALTTTTTYYVQVTNGCVSDRTPVTVTVSPIPAIPTAANDSICAGSAAVLTVPATGDTFQWFASATGSTVLATGNTFTTPALSNSTSYYVQATNSGGCTSARSKVNVTVSPIPVAPSASGFLICSGTSANLTATAPGGNYSWYDAATGGNLLASGASYTTPPLITAVTYYVQTTVGGCTSSRTAVTVSVLAPVSAPAASNVTICSESPATLTATGGNNTYQWYDSPTAGNLLSSAQVYVTPTLTTSTTYYVQSTSNGCSSTRTPVTVTVNTTPPAPAVSGTTAICEGFAASLTATASADTIQWYSAATGGTLLATGSNYTTPVLHNSTTYYAQSVNSSCTSGRTPITVTVTPSSDSQFQYSSSTYCISAANPVPVIQNASGGTFSASPAGLVFASNTTGEINIAASSPGTYTVAFTGNGSCPNPASIKITIVSTTNAQFSYSGPFCQDGGTAASVFVIGAGPGVFSASPGGLVFVSTGTGEINLSASAAGTYMVTNTISANGGCAASVFTNTVVINQAATVSAGPDQSVPGNSVVQLAGAYGGSATSVTWSGGTGTFSSTALKNATYTPGPGETSATLTLTTNDPAGLCGAASDQVVISFFTVPATPTASGTSVCYGSVATLSATAPGGTYKWYDAVSGGNLLATGPNYTTPSLTANTTYYVQTTVNGTNSSRAAVTVVVNSIPAAPIANNTSVCNGYAAILKASGSAGNYAWYDALTGGNLLSTDSTFTTPALTANAIYYVQVTINGCTSARTQVDVQVNPPPNVTSDASGAICSGNAINYTITADISGSTFMWSRAQVSGISNSAVSNQSSATISETLVNTTGNDVNVTYTITPTANGCAGSSFSYVVTVYPTPAVTGSATDTICYGSATNYNIVFNTPQATFTWGRAAVSGISNIAVSGQASATIREVLFNTTGAPVVATYTINYATGNCSAPPFTFSVTVNPNITISSPTTGTACNGVPQTYQITSNVPSAVFTWSRGQAYGVSNPAVSNQISNTINEALIDTTSNPVGVIYTITSVINGCVGPTLYYNVTVYPTPLTPIANSNSPICSGSTIQLLTPGVPNATYLWTGPNGFTSTAQNTSIKNASAANAGTYILYALANGCSSVADSVTVAVDLPPTAKAGTDTIVCKAITAIPLNGIIGGGTSTGIWTSSGSGTFTPAANVLNAQYIPSTQDKNSGSVTLTLSSTSPDDCTIAADSRTISFEKLPAADAGPDQGLCSQTAGVQLNGKILISGGGLWSTSGTGTFSPSASQLNPIYMPSAADVASKSVTLTLKAVAADTCYIDTDQVVINFLPPPTVNAGGTRYVVKGQQITLYPTVSDSNITYLWTPNTNLSDNTSKNPVVTGGNADVRYTLSVTNSLGCTATDTTLVKVIPEISIPNTFTPNGDGVNDLWDIEGLSSYNNATVDIFNRNGQRVYHSLGYGKSWDGTYNGAPLPFGTYYYIIDTKDNSSMHVFSGHVTIVR